MFYEDSPLSYITNFRTKDDSFISEDRKVMQISDVDSFLPDNLKKLFSLVDEIIEINKETISLVYKKIEESGEKIVFVDSIIWSAFKIRPLSIEQLHSLQSLLSLKCDPFLTFKSEEEYLCWSNDLDLFIKKNSEIGFDPEAAVEFSPYTIENPFYCCFSMEMIKASYLQVMAFYGAIKCFKQACLTGEYDFNGVEKYAVIGE